MRNIYEQCVTPAQWHRLKRLAPQPPVTTQVVLCKSRIFSSVKGMISHFNNAGYINTSSRLAPSTIRHTVIIDAMQFNNKKIVESRISFQAV